MSDIWSGIGVDISSADGEWLYRVKGEVKGPVPRRALVDKLLKGEVTLETPVAREGGGFHPIGRVAAFAEHLEDAAERQRKRIRKRRAEVFAAVFLLLLCGGAVGGYFTLEEHKRRTAELAAQAKRRAAAAAERAEQLRKAAPKMELVALVSLGTEEDVKIRRPPSSRRPDGKRPSGGGADAAGRKAQSAGEEELVSSCKLSQNDIFATLRRHLGKLNVCVEDEKGRDTQGLLPDTLELDFVVKPSGEVVDFSIDNRHYRRGPMNNCMIKAFRTINFPTSTGSNCPVTIPIKIGG